MARGELIRKLFASFGHEAEFRAVAELIIEDEEKKNNKTLAKSLRRTLDALIDENRAQKPRALAPLIPFPDAAAELVEPIEPTRTKNDVILSAENARVFERLLKEYRRADEIRRNGLPVRSRLLFCGPPGTGKTLAAEVFAGELKLPLFVVKLDRLISSFLGETAGNVRRVFEFARKQPCVVFLDEFDALARARDDTSEHSELRRVVNSLLIFIERIQPNGFLIAATNLDASIDTAIWRRFDEVIWFDMPKRADIVRLLKRRFRNVRAAFDPSLEADAFVGFSFADIDRACLEAIKAPIIDRREAVEPSDLQAAIRNMKRRRGRSSRAKQAK